MNKPVVKTIALFEIFWDGHYPSFFKWYCQALLERGHRVIAFCPQSEEVRQWEPEACRTGHLEAYEFTDAVHGHYWKRKLPQLTAYYRFQQSARRLAAWETHTGRRIDLAFFASFKFGTSPFGGADAVFPYRWTALLLDSGCVRVPAGPKRWWQYRSFDALAVFRARNCVSFATLDGSIRDPLSRRTGKPVHVLPDRVDSSPPRPDLPLAQVIREQAGGRAIIGCLGQFARRKGALAFLRLAQACRDEPWFFFWAGQACEGTFSKSEWRWVQEFLASRPTNCLVEFGRLKDDSDFNALVAISQVIYLCYLEHLGSSNMVGKAAAFEKPVLVSDGYCMADQVRRYDIGLCVPDGDTAAARDALHRLLASDTGLPSAHFAAYLAFHSPAMFTETIQHMADELEPTVVSPGV